jgi:hypothetical protein
MFIAPLLGIVSLVAIVYFSVGYIVPSDAVMAERVRENT